MSAIKAAVGLELEQRLQERWSAAPEATANGAAVDDARRLYELGVGWTVANDVPRGGLCLDLAASGLISLEIPAGVFHGHKACELFAGLHDVIGYNTSKARCEAPSLEVPDHDRSVVILFAAPAAPSKPIEVRSFVLDVSTPASEFVRPSDERRTTVPLPSAGVSERWLSLRGKPPAWPGEWEKMLTSDFAGTDEVVAAWVDAHYVHDDGAKATRAEVYAVCLAANGWVPSQLSENAFGRAVNAHSKELGKTRRTKYGIVWALRRRDPDAKPARSKYLDASECFDALEIEQFKRWRVSVEMSPERKRERREQAESTATRERAESDLRARFGSREMRDALLEKQDGMTYFEYHAEREQARRPTALALGLPYRSLDLHQAKPEWWTKSGKPGTPHSARYATLVATFGVGAQ